MPTIHVHIGESKTGTTSVQTALQMSRDALKEAGYWYPVAAGFRRQADLVDAMEPNLNIARHKSRGLTTPEAWQAFRDPLIAAFDEEHKAHEGADCIVSSEHFPSLSRDGLALFKEFLAARFDRAKVYFYFRNPVDFEISIHSTRIKAGKTTSFRDEDKFNVNMKRAVSRHQRLRNWEDTFGIDNVEVGFFSRSALTNQSVVDDLLGRIGIDPAIMVMPKDDKNEALNLVTLEVLRRLNEGMFDTLGYTKKQRWAFVRAIGQVTTGESLAVRPETAARINEVHRAAVEYYSGRCGVPVERILETKRVRAEGPTLETFELGLDDALLVIGDIKKPTVERKVGGEESDTAGSGDGAEAEDRGDAGQGA